MSHLTQRLRHHVTDAIEPDKAKAIEAQSDRHCVTCGKRHTFTPSLKDRGMSWKTAKALFIDPKKGNCSECWTAKNGGKRHYTTAPTLEQLTTKQGATDYANNV